MPKLALDELALILQRVEDTGSWPSSVIAGYTTLIPKSDQPPGNPLDMRPIAVLGSVYRLWARVRAKQLGATWQERWAHTGMWGGRVGRGPQPLLLEVALDLELAGEHEHAGGLSFDLSKCFDRVPHGLLEEVLDRMRMPTCVKRPYLAMLRSATRRYYKVVHSAWLL